MAKISNETVIMIIVMVVITLVCGLCMHGCVTEGRATHKNRYASFCKVTGNPHELTYEEWSSASWSAQRGDCHDHSKEKP